MSFRTVTGALSADVAPSGNFTVSYPPNTDSGAFTAGVGHKLVLQTNDVLSSPADFTLTFGTSNITVTLTSTAPTLKAGTAFWLQLEKVGEDDGIPSPDNKIVRAVQGFPMLIDLGAPDTLSATAVCAAQAVGGAVNLTINGASASNGVATMDVPRNVSCVSANAGDTTQTLTVYGTDEYGVAMQERLTLNGTTTVQGKKAFKTVTRVAASATTAGNISVGNNDVLGLPVFLPGSGVTYVVKELQDNAVATAGTVLKGDDTKPSLTTGDVRGTYDPNAACDGARSFQLIAFIPDPNYLGLTQFNG